MKTMLVRSSASTNRTCSNAETFDDVVTSAISSYVSIHVEIDRDSDGLTCPEQSEHSEAKNTAYNTLSAAYGVLSLAGPGPLPRLLLPMLTPSPLFVLQEDGHGVSIHIWMFAWRGLW